MAFSAITALASSYSIISYNQISLIVIYMGLAAYSFLRTYFHYVGIHNTSQARSDNIRFILYLFVALVFIYCFSRAFNDRERRRYIESKKQRQLLQLFESLIKSHHDGILITSGENILFHNSKVKKIFTHSFSISSSGEISNQKS